MLEYLLLLCTVTGVAMQAIIQKSYNALYGGVKNSNYLHNFVMSFFACLCFLVIFLLSPETNPPSLIYSLFFAVTICMAIVFQFLAIKTGPLALTALVFSFSLLIPTFYGVIFCGEGLSLLGIIGIVLLVISLFLVNDYSKSEKKITKKYLIFLILAFLGNGFCSTFQKMHQIKFDGRFGGFFMFAAMSGVALFNLLMLIIKKPENRNGIYVKGSAFGAVTGIANGLVNYLMVLLSTRLPSMILYPTVSAGSTLLVFVIAVMFFRERFKSYQYVGYAVGIAAIVFLNL